ncbi:myotubularin-related protein DDB_G0290005-like [Drosophila takahashii]|uniref:myotubularin-related protein DDB_G0290005-like n=1 Tax=Drosophila takahashii TaxID=29030 RepID=UPI003898FBE2
MHLMRELIMVVCLATFASASPNFRILGRQREDSAQIASILNALAENANARAQSTTAAPTTTTVPSTTTVTNSPSGPTTSTGTSTTTTTPTNTSPTGNEKVTAPFKRRSVDPEDYDDIDHRFQLEDPYDEEEQHHRKRMQQKRRRQNRQNHRSQRRRPIRKHIIRRLA